MDAQSLNDGMLVPALLYGCETFFLCPVSLKIRTVEIDSLLSIAGIRRINRVRNGDLRKIFGVKK